MRFVNGVFYTQHDVMPPNEDELAALVAQLRADIGQEKADHIVRMMLAYERHG